MAKQLQGLLRAIALRAVARK